MSGKWHFSNIKDLKAAMSAARQEAEKEAKQSSPLVFARAVNLSTAKKGGEQCRPRVEADCPGWKKTWKEIAEVVADVEANYPDVVQVYISGGYDGAESIQARWVDHNYEPWQSSWNITVWEREETVRPNDPKIGG